MPSLCVTLLVVAIGAVVAPVAQADSNDSGCTGVTRSIPWTDDGPKYNAVVRIRCHFRVTKLSLGMSRSLIRIENGPGLRGERDFESMTCGKGRGRGICTAPDGLKSETRISIRFAVPHGPCGRPGFRLEASAFGGVDGEPGEPVPLIGLTGHVTITGARACVHVLAPKA
jgi:hypothetical protein